MTTSATLCLYGSAAFILLDEPDRASLDVDVAAAIERLPSPFNHDPMLRDNFENLRADEAQRPERAL